MSNRRTFIALMLAAAASPAFGESPQTDERAEAAVLRLRKLYGSLKTYVDITHATTEAFGLKVSSEIRSAFAGGRLCTQTITNGKGTFSNVIDGVHLRRWSSIKGWSDIPSLDPAIELLGGDSLSAGRSPSWLGYLLLDQRYVAEYDAHAAYHEFHGVTCTSPGSGLCTALRAPAEGSPTSIELDPRTGAIRRMISEFPGLHLNVVADIDAHLDVPVDIDFLIREIQQHPEHTLEVMGRRI